MIKIMLALFMFVSLLTQSGCAIALGGAKVTNEVVFVEPGGVVRIATDKPIKIFTTTADKTQVVVEKSIAGMYVMPESVYLKLTQEWEKNHPATKPAAEAVLPKKLKGMDTVAEEVESDPPLVDENADHTSWVAEKRD